MHAYMHINSQSDYRATLCNHLFFKDFRRLYARMHALVYTHTPPRFCAIHRVKDQAMSSPAWREKVAALAEALAKAGCRRWRESRRVEHRNSEPRIHKFVTEHYGAVSSPLGTLPSSGGGSDRLPCARKDFIRRSTLSEISA